MRLYTVLVIGAALAAGIYSDNREARRCRAIALGAIRRAMAGSRP